ncbi:MAG: bifunctional UDP-N-acetylglucosamine pyrophosphorylase/glucosamine-1-phosphate N-acetyltransferase [Candidatus Azotimanducaceae bacterium]|jgi:bifunctional UDP-N-acetylglucosamine pyrophosphorylase/glucosamine-1-phosphate N-acetyltransferase
MSESIEICILAAGKGSRMNSSRPKTLQSLAGRPLLEHLLGTTHSMSAIQTHVVVGSGSDQVRDAFATSDLNFVDQTEQLGTGHAVQQVLPHLTANRVLILLGDAPLVSAASLSRLLAAECDLGVLTVDHPSPFSYGRIIHDGDQIKEIVEERDASHDEQAISEINTGVMIADVALLTRWLGKLRSDNDQEEYLLTDIVSIARQQGHRVVAVKASNHQEVQGVNDYSQLAELEQYYQKLAVARLQAEGVQIVDPQRFTLRGELTAGQDVLIDVNCIFEGQVKLGNNVKIGANVIICNAEIGDDTVIKPFSHIDGAVIEDGCSIGPFTRLRPGTYFESAVAVGNFVEIKKSRLGVGAKASHLSYLGDAIIGTGVNVGAGVITCNYDGVNKFETHIEDGVFVGSNTSLVAPVTLGEASTIAAGSVITSNVPSRALGVGRGKQRNIEGWKGPRDK